MRFHYSIPFAIVPALFLGLACEETVRPPVPPADASRNDGTVIPPPTMGRDSGADADLDAGDGAIADGSLDGAADGSLDAGLPLGCFPAGEGTGTDALIVGGAGEFPFNVTRSFATWDQARCGNPTILIGLTEGACTTLPSDIAGRTRLIFALDESAIGGTIVPGPNTLQVEPDTLGLTVRFSVFGAGGGLDEWGTCAGSSGTVTFDNLETILGRPITASYDMTLTDCAGGALEPIAVSGTFDMLFEVPLEAVCM